MIGALVEGKHKKHGPVLILSFLNRTPEPVAIFMKRDATLAFAPLSELSLNWHYDEIEGFVGDTFGEAEA